ncbi:hypothetical protein VIGAN_04086700 [Vigna angularis var. angularis]|uniref:Uncharacterized protein n=1 Tax=Vigna angularis var. angularis TaxID=157739 RepID=A0A0S3RT02_PHAAN|nr:hypothetical protein VIGAN_04086700 [Vigna angularis var. angularis]
MLSAGRVTLWDRVMSLHLSSQFGFSSNGGPTSCLPLKINNTLHLFCRECFFTKEVAPTLTSSFDNLLANEFSSNLLSSKHVRDVVCAPPLCFITFKNYMGWFAVHLQFI